MSREMKDSGIAWLGMIPSKWDTISFSQGTKRLGTGLNPRDNFVLTKDDEFYYVTIRNYKNGILYLDDRCDRISKTAWEIIQERSQLEKGDILFASISQDGQAYIVSEEPRNWNINESVFSIKVDNKRFYEKYFYYHLIDKAYYSDLRMDATGTTFQSIKQNKLKKSRMVLPPLSEQHRIANYLDEKCAEIDNVLEKTRASIEEYKKLKQSVITLAVTRGVRGDRPMKDSGIEWIGVVPEDWNVKRGKALFHEVKNQSTTGTEELLTVSQYTGITPRSQKNVTMFQSESLVGYKIVEIGDIGANTMWLWDGAIGVSTYRGVISPSYNVYRQSNGDYDSKYLDYLLRNPLIVQHYKSRSTGIRASRLRLYPQQFLSIMFPVPDINEQRAIAEYLDTKCKGIETLIEKKNKLIADLEEYKKSLIYEYVTGKKEVPQT